MAIVQISRITHRKGLQENLPQLAGAEFGWSVDERRLFIGNGTLEDGAPTIGNTEILTEHSNLLQLASGYTYRGEHAGYVVQTGPAVGMDVARSMQAKLDECASVLDFGAAGDGVTDDTAAINRALYEVFCRDSNPKVRRSLYFPAGTYLVSSTIMIPPYAKLFGEGVNSSVIVLDPNAVDVDVVARTCDSLQYVGAAIGSISGSIPPSYVEVWSMTFQSAQDSSIFSVDQGFDISFQNVGFIGDRTLLNNTNSGSDTFGLTVTSTPGNKSKNIRLNQCLFYGTTNGILINDDVKGVSVTATRFDTLYNGVQLGTTTASANTANGVVVSSCIFDHVYNTGMETGPHAVRNISANNVYLDVGNGYGASPQTHIIWFKSANNISIGDMFERSDVDALVHQHERVHFANNDNISIENGVVLRLGSLSKVAGDSFTLINDTSTNTLTPIVFDNGHHRAVTVHYSVVRGSNVRVGRINVMQIKNLLDTVAYTDDHYTSTGDVGVTFTAQNVGYLTYIYFTLTNDAAGDATLSYSLEYFRDPTLA